MDLRLSNLFRLFGLFLVLSILLPSSFAAPTKSLEEAYHSFSDFRTALTNTTLLNQEITSGLWIGSLRWSNYRHENFVVHLDNGQKVQIDRRAERPIWVGWKRVFPGKNSFTVLHPHSPPVEESSDHQLLGKVTMRNSTGLTLGRLLDTIEEMHRREPYYRVFRSQCWTWSRGIFRFLSEREAVLVGEEGKLLRDQRERTLWLMTRMLLKGVGIVLGIFSLLVGLVVARMRGAKWEWTRHNFAIGIIWIITAMILGCFLGWLFHRLVIDPEIPEWLKLCEEMADHFWEKRELMSEGGNLEMDGRQLGFWRPFQG